MYRSCIFCSADLGTNDVIETFPVGKRVAFDAAKGRLWAICPKCTRWNLAPIEERWEAVEEAEKSFRDSRLRVQSENIGMAKMRDGTYLIRVGSALQGELAAWRYGRTLVDRYRKQKYIIGGVAAAGLVFVGGIPFLAAAGFPFAMLSSSANLFNAVYQKRMREKVLMRIDAASEADGELKIKGADVPRLRLSTLDDRLAIRIEPAKTAGGHLSSKKSSNLPASITGVEAEHLASRIMVTTNKSGASQQKVNDALKLITSMGSPEGLLLAVGRYNPAFQQIESMRGEDGRTITPRMLIGETHPTLTTPDRPAAGKDMRLHRTTALAVEMALHEESERRAMQGELAVLEEAWREAEQIARIADALPDEPPED